MRIDIVADIVCPWSFIGVRRLASALRDDSREAQDAYQIYWRPYLLNPDVGPEGADQPDILARTIGPQSRVKRFQDTVQRAGDDVGIGFRFDLLTFVPFALPAHRLICRFNGHAQLLAVADCLYSLHFEQGADISSVSVLAPSLAEFGVSGSEAAEAVKLAASGFDGLIMDDGETQRLGINGVPSFIFGGEHVISGAHDQTVLGRMLDIASVVEDRPLSPI